MSKQRTGDRIPTAVGGIQVNFCKNPKCQNFGVPVSIEKQSRGPGAGERGRDAYRITTSRDVPAVFCFRCHEQPAIKSNLGIHEEISRLSAYLAPSPEMVCPNENCRNHIHNPTETVRRFRLSGRTQSGSQRFKCRACGVTFSVGSSTNRQKVPHKNLTIFRLLMNKVPFRRICEVAGIGHGTLYSKIDFIHRQCMLFVSNREQILPEKQIRRLYVSVDRQDYVINWTSSADRRNVTLHAVGAADNTTGYVLGAHVNFDPSMLPKDVEKEVRAIGDDSIDPPFRRYARLWIAKDYYDAILRSGQRNLSEFETGSLMKNIALTYKEAEGRPDTEISEKQDEDTMLPISGMQVHAEYTLHGHFFFLRKLFNNVEKVRFFLDQDSGIRAACLSAFCDRIKESRCDAFYVRIKTEITIDEKRRILAESRRRFEAIKALHPDFRDSQVRLFMIKERLKELTAVGRWKDRWVEHPFPNMGEPEALSSF